MRHGTSFPSSFTHGLEQYPGLSVAGLGIFMSSETLDRKNRRSICTPRESSIRTGSLSIFKRAPPTELANRQAVPADSKASVPALSLRELWRAWDHGRNRAMSGSTSCTFIEWSSPPSPNRLRLFCLLWHLVLDWQLCCIVGLTLMVYAKRAISSRVQVRSTILGAISLFVICLHGGVRFRNNGFWCYYRAGSDLQGYPLSDKLFPFLTVILLGLFLGMRSF